jgi:hypothetical protein
MYPPETNQATPMEYVQANYDVIWAGCWGLGVVCIEAGANGSQNLDSAIWGGIFDRNVRDSGAIMVGAGTPYGRVAEWFTNYGSRMDAHGWGSSIVTTGYGDLYDGGPNQTEYTSGFSGTSGASPMVTGASLCLQGIAEAAQGSVLTPVALRALITDTGVPHLDPSKEIGPRPDLAEAAAQLVDLTAAPGLPAGGGIALRAAPNPFGERTELRFALPAGADARVRLYDAGGRLVRTLASPAAGAGERALAWDGRDAAGRDLPSGVFFYRLESSAGTASGRLVKLR